MKIRKFNNGWSIKLGNVNGASFMATIRYFSKIGFRVIVNLNTDRLIKVFRFNQKIWGV